MNTFELVVALAPLPRYDARYARAVGQPILSTANAAWLFYANQPLSAATDHDFTNFGYRCATAPWPLTTAIMSRHVASLLVAEKWGLILGM
jgi:hypothetical protein